MRLTSSARTGTSTGTSSSSVRVRLRSVSCITMISLASVNRRLQKVIVDLDCRRPGDQRDEIHQRFSAQMRSLHHRDLSGVREKHPYRNLQSLACRIYNRDCTVSPFRPPRDPQAITVQRMKRIENADVRDLRTQGIVGGFCTIRICIAWCPAADFRRIASAGYPAGPATFSVSMSFHGCSVACSSNSS